MASQPDTFAPAVAPDPPRFRRLKRWSVTGVIIALALIGLRLWWGYEAHRRYDALISRAHVLGERILPEDFNPPSIPDSQNAATFLMNAAKAIKLTAPQEKWENTFDPARPLSASDVETLRQIVQASATSLAQARQARDLTAADFSIRMRTPVFMTTLPHLNFTRVLSNIQLYDALYCHHTGNDAEAIEALRDMLRLQNAITQPTPFRVTVRVADYFNRIAARTAAQIAIDLDIAGPTRATTRPATRENIRALIADFLDESILRQAHGDAWINERMMDLDNAAGITRSMRPTWLGDFLEPMYRLNAMRNAANDDDHRAAATQSSYPAALARVLPTARAGRSSLHKTVMAIRDEPSPWDKDPHFADFRALAARRLAALALAIRLYAIDHGNQLPPRLEDLVPDYLPRLPADPFTADGQNFRYHPAATQPVVYTVGQNGADDGGVGSLLDPEHPGPDEIVRLTSTTQPSK